MSSDSFRARTRQEVLQELARDPASLAEYVLQLQEQLSQKEQLLAATHQELVEREQLLAEARSYIAELKRQLFGPKADQPINRSRSWHFQAAAPNTKQAKERPWPSRTTYCRFSPIAPPKPK